MPLSSDAIEVAPLRIAEIGPICRWYIETGRGKFASLKSIVVSEGQGDCIRCRSLGVL